jgi:hypothetical protein
MLLAQKQLDNGSIITLLKAGISEDLIISTVNASRGYYDTSASGLIALKRAGASDKVITAMVVKNAHTVGETPTIFPPKPPDPAPVAVPRLLAPAAPAIPVEVDSEC